MLSYQVSNTPCENCLSCSSLMNALDTILSKYGSRLWKNKVYLLGKPLGKGKLKTLLYYKDILKNLMYDPFYYGQKYPYQNIDSRIKELINGLH